MGRESISDKKPGRARILPPRSASPIARVGRLPAQGSERRPVRVEHQRHDRANAVGPGGRKQLRDRVGGQREVRIENQHGVAWVGKRQPGVDTARVAEVLP